MNRPVGSPFGRLRDLRGGRLALAIALALGLLLVALRVAASLQVDLLWFESVGYRDLFLRRLAWSWGTRLVVGVAVGVVLFFNLRLVAGTLGAIQVKRRFGDLVISEQLPRSYVLSAAAALSALIGLWFGGSVVEGLGIQTLVASRAAEWGARDPVFALDLAFYALQLPLLRTAVTFAMVVVFLVFTVCLGGYAATGALRWGRSTLVMGELPRVHLGGLLAAFLVLIAARLWLGRYLLLMYGTSEVQGIFGYTDAQARLPALQLMTVVTLVSAAVVFWGAWKNRAVPVLAGMVVVAAGGILGVQFYPSLVQRFRVEPNELSRESPYIEMNLRFTRLGFGLDDLERRRFDYRPPGDVDWEAAASQLDGLPVWTNEALLTAYQALEARYRYYDFTGVAIDRYPTEQGRAVVALSVREVEPTGIEDQNWQNLHLRERYMAGMGAVASDAADRTAEGRPSFFLSQIPPEFQRRPGAPEAIEPERTSVFFGMRTQPYAVVNPADSSFLAPDGTPGRPGLDYPKGIPLSSALRTLAFAWDLGEPNLLFASEVDDSSRIVIRRQVATRVERILPYLRYPEDPYPVVHEGRLVWVLDGFTGTRYFPLSVPREVDAGRQYAYVRNSVRVVVDAVSGDVAFYRLPGDDPLLDAYEAAFPGVFRSFEDLPAGLREHLRYSRHLLELQADVLLQYHQETPAQFHGQQDVWATPTELGEGENAVTYQPEYGLWTLPEEREETFLLTTTFVPAGRQNLTALLAGRVGSDGVRELFLYDIAVEDQAPGPRQVEALVEQDPAIRQQFALWRTGGSRVWTGHLHVVPTGGNLVFMEAVYLAAQDSPIPELRRYVLSDGRSVVMTPTLGEALAAFGGEELAETVLGAELPRPTTEGEPWPGEALELLQRAEARLRAGDWTAFGTALRELRDLLERLSAPAG